MSMLSKTNIKAIKMADKFVFSTENGKSSIRCIKKGQFDENEPFAQPDVHHDIETENEYQGEVSGLVTIESEADPVVQTILGSLKEEDELTLIWQPLGEGRHMLSLTIERKGKTLHYILAVQTEAREMRQAA
jgi:hypothetical protein